MKLKGLFLLVLLILVTACGQQAENDPDSSRAASSGQEELLVSAAASLQEVLTALEKDYREQHLDVKLVFNFGSSGTLQRQIEQGAPVDLFISAGEKQMDELERQELILTDTREDLLSNQLVLITGLNVNDVTGLADLEKDSVSMIALGVPETSPAGQYTKEALVNLELWEPLQDKLIMAKDVKQVLTYVETGNADVGFLYASDALSSEKIKIIENLPPDLHEPIIYPAAIVKETKKKELAQAFMEYLNGENARRIFEDHGFTTVKRGN